MKDCFWCQSHVGIARVITPQGNAHDLCRDCRAINAREMKGGA
jgi:hypothetical protein